MADVFWTGTTNSVVATGTNWSTGFVPATSENVIIPANATVNMAGGTIVASIASFTVEDGCTITIGTNVSGVIDPLVFNCTGESGQTVDLGGTGVTYLKVTGILSLTVRKAGTSQTKGVNPLNISSTDAIPTINIIPTNSAFIGLASLGGEALTCSTNLNVTAGTVFIGSGVILDTANVNQSGGVIWNSAVFDSTDVLTIEGGTFYHLEGAMNSIVSTGGTVYYNSTGILATLVISNNGTIDFSQELGGRTVSAADAYAGATINDPNGDVTWTASIDLNQCGLDDVTLNVGRNFRLTKASVA